MGVKKSRKPKTSGLPVVSSAEDRKRFACVIYFMVGACFLLACFIVNSSTIQARESHRQHGTHSRFSLSVFDVGTVLLTCFQLFLALDCVSKLIAKGRGFQEKLPLYGFLIGHGFLQFCMAVMTFIGVDISDNATVIRSAYIVFVVVACELISLSILL